jgi:hypothetical protein
MFGSSSCRPECKHYERDANEPIMVQQVANSDGAELTAALRRQPRTLE